MINLVQNYLTRGFWGDEAWTSLISQLPYLQMLKTTAADFHPPAYYTIVELVYKIAPPTEVVTRLISTFFYLATAFLVWRFATKFLGKSSGFIAALVILTNPIFFRYALEARNYTMFAFAAVGSIYYLVNLTQKFSKRDAILFVLFSALGIYTHYYMFFTLAAEGFYVLLFERKILAKIIGLYTAIGVLYLPWIPFLAKQVLSATGSYWIAGINNRTHFEAVLRIWGGEEQNVFRPFLFWLTVGSLVFGLWQTFREKLTKKAFILVWFWAIVPFVLATLPGLKIDGFKLPLRPFFFWRYLIPAAVPFSILIVYGSRSLPKVFSKTLLALIIILSVLVDFLMFSKNPATFRQIFAEEIVPKIKPGDKIVTVLPSFAEVLYYRNRFELNNELVVLPEGLIQSSGKSLLDSYAANGTVKITAAPEGRYFELRPGPSIRRMEKN